MHLGRITSCEFPKRHCCFSNFDAENTGKITRQMFIQILKTKEVPEKDIQEMLDGNSSCGLTPFSLTIMFQLTKMLSRQMLKRRMRKT